MYENSIHRCYNCYGEGWVTSIELDPDTNKPPADAEPTVRKCNLCKGHGLVYHAPQLNEHDMVSISKLIMAVG